MECEEIMSDVLSQNEIDNLLAAISSGELDADEFKQSTEKHIKNYDFARPSKFSKEHLRTLNIIFEHYGRLLATNLPVYLRKNVQVEVVNAEAVTYSEFTNALSNPVLLGIIDFAPLDGQIIIELADNLGYAIVDRMLGGGGYPLEKVRDFSEIELSIIERIFNVCTNLLREPWINVIEIEPRLIRIETNSQFAQIISPSEMISIVTMNIKIGNIESMMNICLPYVCLEKVIDKLNTKYWYSTMKLRDDKSYKELIEIAISKANVPLRAVLGKSTISVNDFVNMQRGDIIKLNSKVDDELIVYVGNISKFTALPGASSGTYAVKISSIIRGEE
jgi:flagellar motor switch protein FliM